MLRNEQQESKINVESVHARVPAQLGIVYSRHQAR